MNNTAHDLYNLYAAIGFISVNWSLIDQGADACIGIISHDCGGDSIRGTQPVSTTQKIEFLKEAFNRLPKLAAFRNEGLEAVRKYANAADFRESLMHSAPTGTAPVNGAFRFTRVKAGGKIHRIVPFNLHLNSFSKHAKRFVDLAAEMNALANKLLNAFAVPPGGQSLASLVESLKTTTTKEGD